MKIGKFEKNIRISAAITLIVSLIMAPGSFAATSFNPSAANLTTVPQGAAPTMNAMTGNAQDPYTPTTTTPDYFGTPDPISGYANGNFANSPLPVSVLIQGAGTGAFYTAEYETNNLSPNYGQVTKFDVVNQGTGYDWQAGQTIVSVIGGGGYGATGTPVIDHTTGAITSITLKTGGKGYGSAKGIRKFITGLPKIPVGTPTALPAVNMPGTAGYNSSKPSIAASDFYEIAAIRSKWQFSADLGYTTVNMYVQVDPDNYGPNCPTGETALTYPNGNAIKNLAHQQVCAFNSNTDPSTKATAPFSYLGPIIVAQQNRPVRVTYDNYLPTGSGQCTDQSGTLVSAKTCGGDLMLPVDSSIMGAGAGPNGGYYSTARSTIHLHGGVTPWISDGTMDQWVTPVGSNEQYPKGVSTRYVPDMWYDASGNAIPSCYGSITCAVTGAKNDPGQGRMTFYYTNQETARLMWYHDHSVGITRLNVYSGLAAGYLLHDENEGKVMVAAGIRNSASPNTVNAEQEQTLIIQDKSFVPATSQLTLQDPTWNTKAWGGFGSLWFPHVYQPNQNPALTPANSTSPGATPTGRWDYGPWMWPAVTTTMTLPVKNPLCNPTCTGSGNWVQNKTNPGVPNVSAVPEAFTDVMTVNGVAYPYVKVAPKVYRFQILNASNDRTMNLAFYYAKSTKNYMSATDTDSYLNGTPYPHHSNNYANKNCNADPVTGVINMWSNSAATTPACADSGEVSMLPADPKLTGTAGLTYPDQFQDHAAGVQDMYLAGPDIVQIGTEGGFLPNASVQPSTPVGFEYSRQTIVTTNVKQHTLILGPAQRADILVDFSNIPSGSTLILYNDAPAPFPGFDPRFDYYTGDADQTAFGGSTTTLPGYAPNTRTIMQIQVVGTKGASLDVNAVDSALMTAYATSRQAPIVPQQAYDAALGTTTVNSYPGLNDSSVIANATGVASIALDPTTVGTHAISANASPQIIIEGGNGNGARAIPVVQDSSGLVSVNSLPGAPTYTSSNLPNVVVTPSDATVPSRTATVLPYIVGGDKVSTITVNNSGAGYTSTPAVTVIGGATTSALAKAVMKPTNLTAIQVNNGGVYTATPAITVRGGGTNEITHAYAQLNTVGMAGVNILTSTLYSNPPALTVTPNQLDVHAVSARLNAYLSTSIQSITVTNAGTCTTTSTNPELDYFDISVTNGGVAPIAPTLVANARFAAGAASLRSIDVVDGGGSYQISPTVVITPRGGISCSVLPTATVNLTPGPIASVVVDLAAIGSYTMTPTISGPNPGDTFQAILEPSPIAAINIINTVNTFTETPTVEFSEGAAVATALLNQTSVDYIQVIDSGSGYIVAPQIAIDAPTTDPNCMVAANCATATVDAATGELGFKVVDPGNGYTANPVVTITGGGQASPIETTANRGSGQVSSIIVTNPGSGYLSAPKVKIYYPADNTTDTVSATSRLATQTIQITYQPKGVGEEFELMYGRMYSVMSSEVPLSNYSTQTTLLWSSVDPATEVIDSNAYDFGRSRNSSGTLVDTMPDGTQLWRYTHNGVDTHFLHFHMFNVQVVARIGWDGVNQPLDNYDLGWRDTIQFDPLTIMYIAVKPIVPNVPWQLPNSVRPLSPSDPIDQVAPMMMGVDAAGNPVTNQTNVLTNFGWEYMIHCHLLGHEENDMMRPMAVGVALTAPTAVSAVKVSNGVQVSFIDNSINETGFRVQRFDLSTGAWIDVATKNQTSSTQSSNWNLLTQSLKVDYSASVGTTITVIDSTKDHGQALAGNYQYRVIATDQIGTRGMGEFPTITSKSDPSNTVYVTI